MFIMFSPPSSKISFNASPFRQLKIKFNHHVGAYYKQKYKLRIELYTLHTKVTCKFVLKKNMSKICK